MFCVIRKRFCSCPNRSSRLRRLKYKNENIVISYKKKKITTNIEITTLNYLKRSSPQSINK
jgi:hypothetical protein